ncbi:MAG TPA: serine/threonine-protein kinase [Planctomycetota bacterium]|nr:serine/threonine-protein kinase [Planctomycetota bacterium]
MASDANANASRSPQGASSSAPANSVAPSGLGVPASGAINGASGNDSLLNPVQMTGRKLGQYTILEKIGQGGMGSVFKAFDTALERTVALKVLFSNPLDDPKQAQRFVREARSLARLNHPNLLHVYNVGVENDCYYFAMELLEGDTLAAEIKRRRRIEPRELIDWVGQVLSALHYVHHQGITHRDIKSGNIMICGRRAVLMDFGLAKDENFSGLTSVGVVLGTPDYISPEAADGVSAGPPTDLYSLGVVMYESLTGALPFTGRSAMSIIRQHMEMPAPPIEGTLPGIDPLLASIVHKCLSKKSTDRYADCTLMARDLLNVHSTPELEHLAEGAPVGSAFKPQPPESAAARAAGSADATLGTTPSGQPLGSLDATIVDPSRSKDNTRKSGIEATMTLPAQAVARARPDEPTVEQTVVVPPKSGHSPYFWAAIGFFGMLLLVFFLAAMEERKKKKRENAAEQWKGQTILRTTPNVSGEKVRWMRFHADDSDPAKWYHEIQRLQPDGTWKTERVQHGEFMGKGGGTFEIIVGDEPSK